MIKTVLLRVDASPKIGLGHLIRCFTIADYLRANDITAFFISNSGYGEKYIAARGFKFYAFKPECTIENEAGVIKELASEMNSPAIIIDLNNYNTFADAETYSEYLEIIKTLSLFTVSFEDSKICPAICDLVVIPYVGAQNITLPETVKSRYLLGPRYFVLSEQFLKTERHFVRKKVENVLISMGGSDTEGLTLKVLSIFNEMKLDIKLNIFIGGFFIIDDETIKNTLRSYKGAYSIIRNVTNMAQHMAESDIAIINSGLTKYETAFVGLPCIIISNNSYHAVLMEDFATHGSALHLGEVNKISNNHLAEAISYLLSDYDKREQMSKAGRSLVDGNGVERIFNEISRRLMNE